MNLAPGDVCMISRPGYNFHGEWVTVVRIVPLDGAWRDVFGDHLVAFKSKKGEFALSEDCFVKREDACDGDG